MNRFAAFEQSLKRARPVFFLALLLSCALPLHAQDDDSVEEANALRLRASVASREFKYGLDVGSGLPSFGLGAAYAHRSGLGVDGSLRWLVGDGGGFESWNLGVGYEGDLSDVTSFSLDLSHHQFAADTISILAPLSNEFSAALDFSFGALSLGLTNDLYFGGTFADYFTVALGAAIPAGDVEIDPELDVTLGSQEVSAAIVGKLKGKDKKQGVLYSTAKVAGLSGASFDVGVIWIPAPGWSVIIDPSANFTPNDALRTQPITLAILASLSKRFDL